MRNLLLALSVVGILLAPMQGHSITAHEQTVETQSAGQLGFNRAMIKAARKANLSRRDMLQLRTGLIFHGDQIRAHVTAQASILGIVDGDGPDWDSIGDFLERILPLVLDFIKTLLELFGGVAVDPNPVPSPPDVIIGVRVEHVTSTQGNDATIVAKSDALAEAVAEDFAVEDVPENNTIVMHTIEGCMSCQIWWDMERPDYVAKGWNVEQSHDVAERGKTYPWFEVGDRQFTKATVMSKRDFAELIQ